MIFTRLKGLINPKDLNKELSKRSEERPVQEFLKGLEKVVPKTISDWDKLGIKF